MVAVGPPEVAGFQLAGLSLSSLDPTVSACRRFHSCAPDWVQDTDLGVNKGLGRMPPAFRLILTATARDLSENAPYALRSPK